MVTLHLRRAFSQSRLRPTHRLILSAILVFAALSRHAYVFRHEHNPVSARMLRYVNCDSACHTTGNYPLRLIVNRSFHASIVLKDHYALGTPHIVALHLAIALLDPPLAAILAVLHIHAGLNARFSTMLKAPPIELIPPAARCLLIGINDFIETWSSRANHSCGYLNYVMESSNATDGYFMKVTGFARALRQYGLTHSLLFLDRDVHADVGGILESLRPGRMAMGRLFDSGRLSVSTNGTNRYKRQTRIIAANLVRAPESSWRDAVDAAERWSKWRRWQVRGRTAGVGDSAYAAYNHTFTDMFDVADYTSISDHCSRVFVNRKDCMLKTQSAIVPVAWNRIGLYVVLLVAWLVALSGFQRYRLMPAFLFAAPRTASYVFLLSCAVCAATTAAWSATPDRWEAWYFQGTPSNWPSLGVVAVMSVATRVAYGIAALTSSILLNHSCVYRAGMDRELGREA